MDSSTAAHFDSAGQHPSVTAATVTPVLGRATSISLKLPPGFAQSLGMTGRPRPSPASTVPAKRSLQLVQALPATPTTAQPVQEGGNVDQLDDSVDENVSPFIKREGDVALSNKRARPSLDSGFGDVKPFINASTEMEDSMLDRTEISDSEGEGFMTLTQPRAKIVEAVKLEDVDDDDDDEPVIVSYHSSNTIKLEGSSGTSARVARPQGPDYSKYSLQKLDMSYMGLAKLLVSVARQTLELATSGAGISSEGSTLGLLQINRSYIGRESPLLESAISALEAKRSRSTSEYSPARHKQATELVARNKRLAEVLDEMTEILVSGGEISKKGNDLTLLQMNVRHMEAKCLELRQQIEAGESSSGAAQPQTPAISIARQTLDNSRNLSEPRPASNIALVSLPPEPQRQVTRSQTVESASAVDSSPARRPPTAIAVSHQPRVAPPTFRPAALEPEPRVAQVDKENVQPLRPLVRGSVASAPIVTSGAAPAAPQAALGSATFQPFRFSNPTDEVVRIGTTSKALVKPAASAGRVLPPARPAVTAPQPQYERAAALNNGKGKGRAAPENHEDLFEGVDFDDHDEDDGEDDIIIHPRPGRQDSDRRAPVRPSAVAPRVDTGASRLKEVIDVEPVGTDPARVSKPPSMKHAWSSDVAKALRQRFGLTGFRANQEDAINASLGGRDVFILLPTGGGKSLCFQLPAVISSGKTKGVTIVISPLLSLIYDQCRSLKDKDIPAIYINGKMGAAARKFAMATLMADPPTTCLAYVTPELIASSDQFKRVLQGLYRRKQLARFVVDEAHCVSSWGHDFRTDYTKMGNLRGEYPGVPFMALTATANARVRTDILANLHMEKSLVLTQSFNRPNLKYEVRPKGKNVVQDIADFIKAGHAGECGIIYCNSRVKCEEVAADLCEKHKIQARHFHALLDEQEKSRIQTGWQAGAFQVICATIAFGMGIDKADVRYVIHHSLPGSLEGYYQETGRAGRDGKSSMCVLYYSYGDTKSIQHLIDNSKGTHQNKESNRDNLNRVLQFCLNVTDCRRTQVLAYFGEDFPRHKCHKTCDVCFKGDRLEQRDVTKLAKAATQLVQEIQSHAGITLKFCLSILRGARLKKIVEEGYDELATFGAALKLNVELGDVERLFQLLLAEGVLAEQSKLAGGFAHSYMIVGKNSQAVLRDRKKIMMSFPLSEKQQGALPAVDKPVGAQKRQVAPLFKPAPLKANVASTKRAHYPSAEFVDDDDDNEEVGGGDHAALALAELTALRKQSATERKTTPRNVISDDALQMLAALNPVTYPDFMQIEGMTDDMHDWFVQSRAKDVCRRYAALAGRGVR